MLPALGSKTLEPTCKGLTMRINAKVIDNGDPGNWLGYPCARRANQATLVAGLVTSVPNSHNVVKLYFRLR